MIKPMIRRWPAAVAAVVLAAPAQADPLPAAGPLALQAFFDGCLEPVGARHDPNPPLAESIAKFKPQAAPAPDAAHAEHKLWRVRGVDGDIEIETFTGKAWCEVRLIGADPASVSRQLNNALARMDVPMTRRSLPGDAPGVTAEAVVLGHDRNDALILLVQQRRDPHDGEAGLILSAVPVAPGQ